MMLGLAMQTYGDVLVDQQEILTYLADILIDLYSADSAVLRARSVENHAAGPFHAAAARVFVNDAAMRVDAAARQALAAMLDGDGLRTMLAALRRLLKAPPINTTALRRRLADEAVARCGYIF
jgi:alkylation response protein AidB-like acyl-CoA dehydrogenase